MHSVVDSVLDSVLDSVVDSGVDSVVAFSVEATNRRQGSLICDISHEATKE